ncbi:hypothetical protein [Sphingomonas hengshuiensis]|uniref:hypothetical protein n=1 Tax=Sphingomonas hengshuiensis TaxID=1609977 RepID=UPI0012B8DAD6|nr:hypothetical protein [Sphingomonas hengshuiensis]
MMSGDLPSASAPELTGGNLRKPWHPPVIEDADISAVTHGGGNSGMEGTPVMKTGS